MKKLIVIGAVLVLLLGGGAWYMFLGGQEMLAGGEAESEYVEKPEYVPIGGLMVPVIRRGQIEGHITLELILEAPDFAARTRIESAMVRVRDAMLREIHSVVARRRLDGRTLYIPDLRKNLLLAAQRVVGRRRVQNVLVKSVFERDLT